MMVYLPSFSDLSSSANFTVNSDDSLTNMSGFLHAFIITIEYLFVCLLD